jgi:hypothetical protein
MKMEVLNRMFGVAKNGNPELHEVMAEMALAKPPVKSSKLQQRRADAMGDAYLSEYAELATTIGIMPPDLAIESFKAFLVAHDLPIYSLSEVIAYMDDIAAKESKEKAGWHWRPLRAKDDMHSVLFGTKAEWAPDQYGTARASGQILKPASDYYHGPFTQKWFIQGHGEQQQERGGHVTPYDRTIPLHALRRIALIEKEHKGPVSFLVSDYALAPAIPHPDPFLMAVVPNPNVSIGEGRFVIDFWDEPGFGIDKMIK